MREIRKNGAKCGEAVTKAGELKCALRQKKKDYDPSFKNYDQMVLSPDAFNWNDIFNNPEYGTYHGTFDFPLCGMSCLTLRVSVNSMYSITYNLHSILFGFDGILQTEL